MKSLCLLFVLFMSQTNEHFTEMTAPVTHPIRLISLKCILNFRSETLIFTVCLAEIVTIYQVENLIYTSY